MSKTTLNDHWSPGQSRRYGSGNHPLLPAPGLVAEPEKPYGSIRHYDDQALARLHFIRTAQWLGFSLDEIGGLLTLQDGTHCDEARVLGEQN